MHHLAKANDNQKIKTISLYKSWVSHHGEYESGRYYREWKCKGFKLLQAFQWFRISTKKPFEYYRKALIRH